ncbi:MAG: tetratricopeptide repeat protein [Myxococcales bacterium]
MTHSDPERDLDAELELRLRLDTQAGPAQRISKDRARELVLAAMASAATASSVPESGAVESSRPKTSGRSQGRTRMAMAAAALLAAFVSGASASLWMWGRERPRVDPVAPTAEPVSRVRKAPVPNQPPPEPAQAEPVDDEPSDVPEKPTRTRRPEAMPEDLLERANSLRAEGAFPAARDAYSQVVRRYPSSLSAYAAQVAAGSLELEHLGQPEQARRLFERALASRPSGALSLEIYQGLAASYAALGRPQDERRILTRLVESYPRAHAATRARARLQELAPAP